MHLGQLFLDWRGQSLLITEVLLGKESAQGLHWCGERRGIQDFQVRKATAVGAQVKPPTPHHCPSPPPAVSRAGPEIMRADELALSLTH